MLSEKQKVIAKFRLEAIEPLLELDDVKSLDPYVNERIEQLEKEGKHHMGFRFSRASIYRWMKVYRNSNQNIWSLVSIYDKCGPKETDRRRSRNDHSQKIDDFYKRPEAINPKDVYELVFYEIDKVNEFRNKKSKLPYPSQATVYRRVQQRDQEDIAKSKKGGRFAYHKYRQLKLQ